MYMNKLKLFQTRRKMLLVLLIVIPFSVFSAGTEVSAVWSRLYKQADSIEYKFKIMTRITEQHSRDMAPVLIEALEDIITNRLSGGDITDRMMNNDLMSMIVIELGNLKAGESAPVVFKVIEESEDPFLTGDAIVALGRMGARAYTDRIIFMLRNLNMGVSAFSGKEQIETLVSSCIDALERLQDPSGFKPVFFVSTGRYSSSVIKRAERALINMVEDPSELLQEIIQTEKSFKVKLDALNAEYRSNAPAENKAGVAAAALEQGLVHTTVDNTEANYLNMLKIGACQLLAIVEFRNPEALLLLRRVLFENYGLETVNSYDELLAALHALSRNPEDQSAELLSDFLAHQNDRQSSGVTTKDNRIVMATIAAIGKTGNIIGQQELIRVEFSNWSGQVVREAEAALQKIK